MMLKSPNKMPENPEPIDPSLTWQSLIPFHVAFDLALYPHRNPVGREQRFPAVALMIDISGFTAMSEVLSSTGRTGAEEITAILNQYFSPMITLIQEYGGIVCKFGGDALTALFPLDRTDSPTVAGRAIRCALLIRDKKAEIEFSTTAGNFNLSMKAGLARGAVFCTTVGDPTIRLEYIIAGSALDLCAEAEQLAGRGQVVTHRELLHPDLVVETRQDHPDFAIVGELLSPVDSSPLPSLPPLDPAAIQTTAAFMHPSTAERILQGQLSFINEIRRVTVLFAGLKNLDYDQDTEVGTKLQAYFSHVVHVVQRYGGYLNKVHMGDKGSTYLVLFGAPIAHEDDSRRALRCALELKTITGLEARIGIDTGFVYCGQVGSLERQEYTVIGNAVNLSARLMQRAQFGQILVSDMTYRSGEATFAWNKSQEISIKGRSGTFCVHPLDSLAHRQRLELQVPAYPYAMIGRQTEMATIRKRMLRVLQGRGQIIQITAPAGMGKTRLAAKVIELATQSGWKGYGGECLSHGTRTSYLVWRNLLRGFFGIQTDRPVNDQVAQLREELAAVDIGLVQRAPLLGLALNLDLPESTLTRSMDAATRKSSLATLIVEAIRQRAEETPLLLLLEDCHWIDPLSRDLLEVVGRNIADRPVLILILYRPSENTFPCTFPFRFLHATEIGLPELGPAEAEELVQHNIKKLYGTSTFPNELLQQISTRAQGNPFYIEEMINWIHDRRIDPNVPEAIESIEIPDNLHSLIISRIDQLAEGPKITLKAASVIGRLFKANWLWGMNSKLGTQSQINADLDRLCQSGIINPDKPDPELEYLFKHIITWEVAYESLALATRRMLHENIGLYIETTYPDSVGLFLDLLAYHYGRSNNLSKQQEYYRRAGDAAQAAFANKTAEAYYERLLPLLVGRDQAEVKLELGKVWELTGRWQEAETVFREAYTLAEREKDNQLVAQSELSLGSLLRARGQYDEALTWLERARTGFTRLGDHLGIAESLREIGVLYWNQGEFDDAHDQLNRALEIAREHSEQKSAYRTIGNKGLIYWTQGNDEKALACFMECQRIATDLEDKLGQSINHTNMGNVHLDRGEYSAAIAHFAQSLSSAHEIGIRQGLGICVGNMGDVYEKQGDLYRALACFCFSLRIALDIGDRLGVGFTTWHIARVCEAQNKADIAQRAIKQAITMGTMLDVPYELVEYLDTYASILCERGSYLEAKRQNQKALDLAHQVDHHKVGFFARIRAIRLGVYVDLVDAANGIIALRKLEMESQEEEERAAIYNEIWRLDNCPIAGQKAAAIYSTLYRRIPNLEFRKRYEAITGERLPAAPLLPPLPETIGQPSVSIPHLLDQVDRFLEEQAL